MITWVRIGLGTALIFGIVFTSGPVTAQGQGRPVPVSAHKSAVLPGNLAIQIKTLINAAILSGDAKVLENGLFDLTINTPELAVLVAKYTMSELSAKKRQKLSKNFSRSLSVAAAVGPATASPTLFKKIIAVTGSTNPRLTKTITSKVESGLADLFNDNTMSIAKAGGLFETAAGLAEPPTTKSASPTG
jgi:hypothetical protein